MNLKLIIASFLLVAIHYTNGQACTDLENCNSCENRGPECLECASNKVLSSDRKQCLDCPTDCAKCELNADDEPTCLECASGYLSEGACIACTLDNCMLCTVEGEVETCTKCDDVGYSLSGGECTGCPTGKYLDDTSCKSCPSKAVTCSTGGIVTLCEDEGVGYVKADDSLSCKSCPSGCTKCALDGTDAKCTECPANHYVTDDGECDYCGGDSVGEKNCAVCGDDGICSECSTSFYLSEEECSACPSHCDECSFNEDDSAEECAACEEEFGLTTDSTSGYCEKCPSNCIVCTNGVCEDCEDGYALFSDDTCKKCPSKCATCHYPASGAVVGDEICDTCVSPADLALKSAGIQQCYDVPTGCDTIDTTTAVSGGVVPCTVCGAGYIVSAGGNCLNCRTATGGVDNCDVCTADAALEAVVGCSTCANGYIVTSTADACQSCVTHSGGIAECTTCTTDDTDVTCTACSGGFIITSDGSACQNCVTNSGGTADCTVCTTDDTDVTCTTCDTGYIVTSDGSACQNCVTNSGGIANCATCTTDDTDVTCATCATGYIINSDTTACLNCKTAPGGDEGCSACTAVDTTDVSCTACESDYDQFTSTDAEFCGHCPTGCEADSCSLASGTVSCGTCSSGYRPTYSDGSATGKCTKCNGNCEVCSTNAADNAQICSDCEDGYEVVSDACEACPENCAVCSESDGELSCTTCVDEFGLDADGNCVACIGNCNECDANGDGVQVCTECNTKYGDNDAQCVACPSNCLTCDYDEGVMICSKCDSTYVLKSGVCEKCPSSCLECSSSTKCTKGKCSAGFAVNSNGECQDCAGLTGIANCALCSEKPDANSSAPCLACSTGYTLKDGLQSGEDAECVSTSELQCGIEGVFADWPSQCAEGGCTDDTFVTEYNQCGRKCYVCGDYANDVFVPLDSCKADNSSGVEVLCTSGYCAMKSQEKDGVKTVAGGCLPVGDTCDNEDVSCQDIEGGDIEECSKCCGTNLCLKDDLPVGLTSPSLAPANSVSFTFVVSILVITMLVQHFSC